MYLSLVLLAGLVLAAIVLSLVRAEWRALSWTAVILACVVPWVGWQDHAHWEGVNWVPFSSAIAPLKAFDVIGNFVLYVPFGFLLVRHHARGRFGVAVAFLAALLLSVLTEWSQVYSHGRFPNMTDVVMNSLGGLAGAVAARWIGASRRAVAR